MIISPKNCRPRKISFITKYKDLSKYFQSIPSPSSLLHMLDRLYSQLTQTIVKTINNSRSLKSIISPIAKGYQNLAGYRKLGLQYDDLMRTEDEAVKEALKRLPKNELQLRMFRQKRAMQASLMQKEALSKSEQMAYDQDTPLLRNIVYRVERELAEKAKYDSKK